MLAIESGGESATAEAGGLEVDTATYDHFGIATTNFCPGERVTVQASISNASEQPVDLVLCPSRRARLTVADAKKEVVWDSDVVKQRKEDQAVAENGLGTIAAGTCVQRALEPDANGIWSMTWPQTDQNGKAVPPGKYSLVLTWRYYISDAQKYEGVVGESVDITVADAAC